MFKAQLVFKKLLAAGIWLLAEQIDWVETSLY